MSENIELNRLTSNKNNKIYNERKEQVVSQCKKRSSSRLR